MFCICSCHGTPPSPIPADVTLHLSRASYYQIVHTLRGSLPAPPTDAPEAEACRDHAAIAHAASLLPANPEEAHIAAQYVAACAQALDSLRLARQYPNDPELILKCTAQSASMMRQARSWRALLARLQAARQKRGADPAASETAGHTEHRALGLMAEALAHPPPPPAPAQPQTPNPDPVADPNPDPIAEAEHYALHHRKRAALIRSLRRLPDKFDVGPMRPEVVHAIVTGTTPILRALDPQPNRATAAA